MSLPIVLRDEAQADLDDAFDSYEGRRAGLRVDLVACVQEVFDRLSANPRLHAVVHADIRKAVVTRFPYSAFYRDDGTRVKVIAVFHSRRDPSIWQGRA